MATTPPETEAQTEAPPEPSAEILAARKALAARYRERNMPEAATAVESGAWDNEPFMLALVDIQPGA